MQYLNIKIVDLRHPNYIGSDPIDRATWLNLSAFCAERENGGVIADCREWKSRMWEQVCGVTAEEVMRPCALWEWSGPDLKVWNYPVEKEGIVKRKRDYASRGGKASGESRRDDASPGCQADASQPANHKLKHMLERKGKERKGIGRGIGKEGESKGETPGEQPEPRLQLESPPCTAEAVPASKLPDDQWLDLLQKDAAYKALDVRHEYARMTAWCQVNHKEPNRRRFINWLNRCDKPMKAEAQPLNGASHPPAQTTATASVQMMRDQRELERIEGRLRKIKDGASHTAWGPEYTQAELDEIKTLNTRRGELMTALGFKA